VLVVFECFYAMVYLVPEWAQIGHSDKWQLKVLSLLNSAGISHVAVSCMGGVTHWNVCTSQAFPIEHNTFEALAAPLAMIHGIILKLLHMHDVSGYLSVFTVLGISLF